MKPLKFLRTPLALAAVVGLSFTGMAADQVDEAFFQQRIQPVLEQQCYKCHAAATGKSKGGLHLDSMDAMKLGGDIGPAVVPGDPERSQLIRAIRHTDEDLLMPPKQALSKDVIADFEKWVAAGAPDSRKKMPVHDTLFLKQAGPVRKVIDPKDLWSFQPLKLKEPDGADAEWAWTTVDRHVSATLTRQHLKPVGDTSRRTLIRRAYFDLIGLPPSPKAVQAFENDVSPYAFDKVIDALLASNHFGERWGRHWLDVARYAESNGGDSNVTYPHAWRYRDYVIAAFNADKPYDQFIREQIAGDLLESKSEQEKGERIVATGFLAVGTKNLNERNATRFRLDLVDEQIDAVTRAFMGVTVACARCHDHKFDPVSARDYYALAGIFLSSNTQYGTRRETDFNINSDGLVPIKVTDGTEASGKLSSAERQALLKEMEDARERRSSLRTADANSMDAVQRRRLGIQLGLQLDHTEAKLYDYDQDGNAITHAMGVVEGRTQDSPLYDRGEASNPGATVPRGYLSALPLLSAAPIPNNRSGRLELADWITADDNPLTARVMVNRIWAHLFGRGLVTTMDNFGVMGRKPSHPELLDHLADEFRTSGWSVKKLIRQLMLTRAYQLSSDVSEANYRADPDNVFLWQASKRRLEAEVLRDTVLYLAGWLDERPLRSQTYQVGDTPLGGRRGGLVEAFNFNVRYRSVYLPILRDHLPESLSLFDFAEPSMIVGQRSDTVVPAQALFLMNSEFVEKNSARFGAWLHRTEPAAREQVRLAYEWLLARPPTGEESRKSQVFLTRYAALRKREGASSAAAAEESVAALAQALFGSAEFRYLN